MNDKAITLVELLVVIVILLALAGILVPVTHVVRSRSLMSGCTSNLSQIGKAVLMYADDHNGWLPCHFLQSRNSRFNLRDGSKVPVNIVARPKEWRDSLAKYTKSTDVFWCPADRFRGQYARAVSDDPEDGRRQLFTSYIIHVLLYVPNPERVGPDSTLRVRLSSLPKGPSASPYLEDALWEVSPSKDTVSPHGLVANAVFLDGRVKVWRLGEPLDE